MDVRDMARLGGLARKKALTAEERQKIARKAGRARKRTMTAAERKESARTAARARWAKAKQS